MTARPAPRRRAHGRPLERARDLARVGAVGARRRSTRSATRSCTVEIGRDGRWALGPRARSDCSSGRDASAETLPVPASGSVPATLGEVDVVFPVLHGPFGEDGTVQGLLELAGVPYVGAGVAASALCMDKDLFKAVLRDSGIPVTRQRHAPRRRRVANPFGYPVFVKPARLGSSVGISKAHDEDELGAGGRARAPPRREGAGRGVRRRGRGRVRRARQPGTPIASLAGRDRRARRVVRLLGEVRRGRHGARDPAADRRRDDRARPGARGRGVRRDRVRGHGARRLLRPRRTARCSSTS